MAVAVVTVGTLVKANAVTTLTYTAFSPGAGSDKVVVVCLSMGKPVPTNVTVTFGGTSMNAVSGAFVSANGYICYIFALAIGSSTSSGNIVASWTTATECIMDAISFSGVDQTTPCTNGNSASSTTGNPSLTVTSATDDHTIACTSCERNLSAPTQTQRWYTNATSQVNAGGQTGAGASSVTLGWTHDISAKWSMAGCNIKQVPRPVKMAGEWGGYAGGSGGFAG